MKKLTNLLTALILLCASNFSKATTTETQSTNNTIQRVRIDFVTPLGYTRHLLLAFTANNAATDGVDYGYDAPNIEVLPDDLNWRIEDQNYVIQGVGAFNATKSYPLAMFLDNSGEIQIALNSLENFTSSINVYIYDSVLETFTQINDANYTNQLTNGDHLDRYFITFSNNIDEITFVNSSNGTLGIENNQLDLAKITYSKFSKELKVKASQGTNLKNVSVYNVLGQQILNKTRLNSNETSLTFSRAENQSYVVVIESSEGVFSKIIALNNL